ncbi:MAG TPA: MerR family transcriptional regulator [Myxococcota bacterium]|nr:MerR family transcriptional regulator [Myxococcota bacterium]
MSWQSERVPAEASDGRLRSIREVCAATGLTARTIRYYEELGLLPGVRRRAGGRRVYGEDELERLRFIQRLKALGLPLTAIRELNAVHAIAGSTRAMLRRLDELLGRRLGEVDARIAELARLREEISRYRDHVERRVGGVGASGATRARTRRAGGRR